MTPRIIADITRIGREISLLCSQIAQYDGVLCMQLKWAWIGVGMNTGEWQFRQKGENRSHFEDALRSAREARAVLTMALASSYVVESLCARVLDEVDRIVVHLRKLANKPAQKRCARSASRLRARGRSTRRVFAAPVFQLLPRCSDEDSGGG